MTLEEIILLIQILIDKRSNLHGDPVQQDKINAMLDKLYNTKYNLLRSKGGETK